VTAEAKRLVLAGIVSATLSLGAVIAVADPGKPCEPSAELELSARTLHRVETGPVTRVTVELSIRSRLELPAVRIAGSLLGGPGFDEAFGIPDEVAPLAAGATRRLRFTLDLRQGRVHELLFSARSEDPGQEPLQSSAYLKVNLDPDLEPEALDDLIQYRAKMRTEGAP
jgi:hypothetical protein